MEKREQNRPVSLFFLTACLVFLIIGAWVGGLNFILDRSGASMQMDSYIKNLPVSDFFLPGIFLLAVYGLAPLPLLVALWTRPELVWLQTLSRRFHLHWAWLLTLGLGLVLMAWLILEVVLFGTIAQIQLVMIIYNLIFLVVIMLPSLRRYYRD